MKMREIQKTSIRNLLQTKGMQEAVGSVCFEPLELEASLIGFIPYNRSDDLSASDITPINMDCDFVLSPYRIRFKDIDNTFPITKQVSIAQGKRYLIERNLSSYLLGKLKKNDLSKYLQFKTTNWADAILRGHNINDCISKNEEGLLVYTANKDDLEFSRDTGDHIWIYNDFLCLCTYLNKVTGLPSYAVFSPEDTIRILSDKYDDESELLF